MAPTPHLACSWASASRASRARPPDVAEATTLLEQFSNSDVVTGRLQAYLSTMLDPETASALPAPTATSACDSWAAFGHASLDVDTELAQYVAALDGLSLPSRLRDPASIGPLELAQRRLAPADSTAGDRVADSPSPAFERKPLTQPAKLRMGHNPRLDYEELINCNSTSRPILSSNRAALANTPHGAAPTVGLKLRSQLPSAAAGPSGGPDVSALDLKPLGRVSTGPTLSRRPGQQRAARGSAPASPLPRPPQARARPPATRTPAAEVINLDSDDDDDAQVSTDAGAPSPMVEDDVMVVDNPPTTPITPSDAAGASAQTTPVLRTRDGEADSSRDDLGVDRLSLSESQLRKQREKAARRPNKDAFLRKMYQKEEERARAVEQRANNSNVKNINDVQLNDTPFARNQRRKQREAQLAESRKKKRELEQRRQERKKDKAAMKLKRKRDAAFRARISRDSDEDVEEAEEDEEEEEAASPPPMALKRSRTQSPVQEQAQPKQKITNSEFEMKRQRVHKEIGEKALNEMLTRDDLRLIDDWIWRELYMFKDGADKVELKLDNRPRKSRWLRLFIEGVFEIFHEK